MRPIARTRAVQTDVGDFMRFTVAERADGLVTEGIYHITAGPSMRRCALGALTAEAQSILLA